MRVYAEDLIHTEFWPSMHSMTPTSRNPVEAIETWFRAHEDGEFGILPPDHASALRGERRAARTIIYTTKPHCLSRIISLSGFPQPIAMIGRYGLPATTDLAFFDDLAERASCVFVGDADPPDILVFAWLKEHIPIAWSGVNDEWLLPRDKCDLAAISIPMSNAEKSTVPELSSFCPGFRDMLGECCSSLLDSGFKIEVEGAIANRDASSRH